MPDYSTDARGGLDDVVRLRLGGNDVAVAESYEVHCGILSQPARFTMRLGHGGVIADLVKRCIPNTPFEIFVAGNLQHTGRVDGYHIEGSVGASELTVFGRDALAPLFDGYVGEELSFNNSTYADLVRAGLANVNQDPKRLAKTNAANRRARSGVKIVETAPPREVDAAVASGGEVAVQQQAIQTKIGDRWLEFIRRYLDREGLFLWAAADGSFVLSEPNAKQKPAYRVVRGRGRPQNAVNVIQAELTNDTTHRFSKIETYSRQGVKRNARSTSKGDRDDPEMGSYGFDRTVTVRDVVSQSPGQATRFCQRKLAEARREGWQLHYVVAGHTTPSLAGGRAVWTPDTVVEVDDDEFDLHGLFYLEAVTFRRAPQTETVLSLMRPEDLLFGEGESS